MLHVLYLVHDLSDPAVRRRVLMLREGGARVSLGGFRRSDAAIGNVEGIVPVDLGRTRDGRFSQRLMALSFAAARLRSAFSEMPRPDLIIARNLEMLALALRARALFGGSDIPTVYECLDIHRLLLRDDLLGRVMRGAERHLARDVRLLLTSSPAFVRHYFEARRQVDAPIEIIENRHFEPGIQGAAVEMPPGPPWRIGWFGALRCLRSLHLLADFSQGAAGRFEIALRGRPALSEFPDFHAFVDEQPHMSFGGPYRNPEDIATIYGQVHFAWLIDFFEDGLNSRWLLPNRLYEGCSFGAVPIALEGTETAHFLKARGIGIVLPEPSAESLHRMLANIRPEEFAALRARVLAHDRRNWVHDRQDCRDFVARLRSMVDRAYASPTEMAA